MRDWEWVLENEQSAKGRPFQIEGPTTEKTSQTSRQKTSDIEMYTLTSVGVIWLYVEVLLCEEKNFASDSLRLFCVFIFFIRSFILESYIAPLKDTTTQRRSQPRHGHLRRTSGRCKIWKGGHCQGMQLNGEIIPCWWARKQKGPSLHSS